jgi:hypothetical protein
MQDELRKVRYLPVIRVRIVKGLHRNKLATLTGWQMTQDGQQRCLLQIDGEPVEWNYPRVIIAVIHNSSSEAEAA